MATGAAVAIVLVGLLPLLLVWPPLRVRYALAVASALAVRDVDDDLLALRAMATLPVRRLLTVVVRELAGLGLAGLGLRQPRGGR